MLRRLLRRAVVLALVLFPALARATPTSPFFVMGEPCQLDTSTANGGKWSAFGTNPLTVERALLPAMTGALCSAKATLVSGQTTYHAYDLPSAQGTYTLTCRMYVETMPSVETRVVDFYSTASSAAGGILTIEPFDGTRYRLRASYRDETTTVCNGSTANGTVCTPVADESCSGVDRDTFCPETNHCESRCEERTFATGVFAKGQWITWTLQQQNGTDAEAAVRLWGGLGGNPPEAYALGGGYQTVGFCAGGANANLACLTDAQCPSSTCTATRKVTINRLRLGKTDTGIGTGAIYYAKCFGYAGADAYPNLIFDTLTPSSTLVTGNWTNQGTASSCSSSNLHLCIDDGATQDGDSSGMKHSVGSQPTAALQWSAVSTPTPNPTPIAVAFESLWKDQESAASGRSIDLEFQSGATVTTDYTPYELNWADDGASGGYYSVPDLVTANSTILANLDTVTTRIQQTDAASREGRMTAGWVSTIRQTADPTVIATIPDRDRDGEQTVCVVGDSISDNAVYQDTLTARLAGVNVTNLYFCTKGGTTPLDFADDFTDIQDGDTTQYMTCDTVKRGTSGRTCDVVTVMGGVNAWHGWNMGPPSNLTTVEGGLAQDGVCETATGSGTGQGQPCRCPQVMRQRTNAARGATNYCTTKGSGAGAFGATCTAGSQCTCASNADCTFAGTVGRCGACVGGLDNGEYCTSGATCLSGNCATNQCAHGAFNTGDFCKIGKLTAGLPDFYEWCGLGCTDAPGCSGVCLGAPSLGAVTANFETIAASNLAYPTPAATPPLGGRPIVVYVAEPAPQYATGTAGSATGPGLGCWRALKGHTESLNRWLRTWTAADALLRFIDADAWMNRKCPVRNRTCSDETCCYTDTVHPNAYGQRLMAEIIYRAFANLDGTHDGTCSAGSCTTGKRGDACSSNADCDYYRMDLTPS